MTVFGLNQLKAKLMPTKINYIIQWLILILVRCEGMTVY
ncbi:hypothetical protein GMES_2585 [Paraglaciecola mesophila KMM 241]|uniref:Uncharacterized protein n=1 Tax=Paraglaciecola mesophila KMM 241 TaxID=1128912 RepID=K6ZNF8_9ALTE|nr:hypothetical protein GMES_2585 [Paraglaciecola mesophila KMM 241]